jgi:hypothetical protein
VNPYAVKHGLGRAWGFSILSFGGWTGYWLYRQRKLFDGELAQGRDDAVFHTVGLFVPILNYFVIYWLYRDLDELRRRAALPGISAGLYLAGAIFVAPIVYSIALGKVNELWDVRTQGYAVDAPVTTVEKVLIGIGIGIWVLYVLVIVLAVVLAAAGGS